MDFFISVGSQITDNTPLKTQTNLHELFADLSKFKRKQKGKDGPYICAAVFKNDGRRAKENVEHAEVIILDIEKTSLSLEELKTKIPYNSLWYSTYSYGIPAKGEGVRARVIIPCTRPVFRTEYSAIVRSFNADLDGAVDPASEQPTQPMFLPRQDAQESERPGFVFYHRGEAFDPDKRKFVFFEQPGEDAGSYHEQCVKKAIGKIKNAKSGERNNTHFGQAKWLGQLSHVAYVSIDDVLKAALGNTDNEEKTQNTIWRAWEAGRKLGPPPYQFTNASEADLAKAIAYTLGHPNKRLVHCEDKFWQYCTDRKHWVEVTQNDLTRLITGWNGVQYGEDSRLNISNAKSKGAIALLPSVEGVEAPDFFNEAQLGVSFKNQFIYIDELTHELKEVPQHPDQRQKFCVNREIVIRPLRPNRWTQFLKEVFEGDEDAEQKILFLAEFVGACLLGIAPRYEKAVILEGSGSNGKSVFLKVVESLFPEGSTCAVPLERFSEPPYIATLVGKRANIVSEIESTELYRSSGIKGVISADKIEGRRLYGQPFTFRPEAGHIFSVNGLPEVRDSSYGFFRRWEVIEFNRTFSPDEQEYGLDKQLIRTEQKNVYTWALLGAKRLVMQGGYTKIPSSEVVVSDWRESTNSVEAFVNELVVYDDSYITAELVYRAYKAWAEQNGFGVLNSTKFGRRLTEVIGKGRKRRSARVEYQIKLRNMPGELVPVNGGQRNVK
jgi:P4 family phage/plasmid primase-like protien